MRIHVSGFLDVIDELNFTPNPIARRLSSGTTHTVAIILPNLTSPSLVERLRGVQSALADSEYALVLYSAETTERLEELFNTIPNKAHADGILIVSIPPTSEHLQHFSNSGVPIVLIDVKEPHLDHIYVDDIAGGMFATQHLVNLGHKKIAFISDPIDTLFSFGAMKNRLNGYKRALKKAGIKLENDFHVEGLPQGEIVKKPDQRLAAHFQRPYCDFCGQRCPRHWGYIRCPRTKHTNTRGSIRNRI